MSFKASRLFQIKEIICTSSYLFFVIEWFEWTVLFRSCANCYINCLNKNMSNRNLILAIVICLQPCVWCLCCFCVIVIECPTPEIPVNGDTFDNQAMYGINDTIDFFCNYGYQLVGKATWTCQDNGKWDEDCIICMRKGILVVTKIVILKYSFSIVVVKICS